MMDPTSAGKQRRKRDRKQRQGENQSSKFAAQPTVTGDATPATSAPFRSCQSAFDLAGDISRLKTLKPESVGNSMIFEQPRCTSTLDMLDRTTRDGSSTLSLFQREQSKIARNVESVKPEPSLSPHIATPFQRAMGSHSPEVDASMSSLSPLPWRTVMPDYSSPHSTHAGRLDSSERHSDASGQPAVKRATKSRARFNLEEPFCKSEPSAPTSLLASLQEKWPTNHSGGFPLAQLEHRPLPDPVAGTLSLFPINTPELEPFVFRGNAAPTEPIRQSWKVADTPISEPSGAMLPSALIPPSVMADGCGLLVSRPPRKKKKMVDSSPEKPQKVLDRIFISRGFGTKVRLSAAEGSIYETTPTALQLASFGTEVFKAVQKSDTEALSALLEAGLSPNPCNHFHDSVLDLVCKRSNNVIFQCLLDHQADIRVCDNFGRTPLHHACWAHSFSEDIVSSILDRDWQQIVMEDKRGQTPLEYVRPELYGEWVNFLERKADDLFPQGGRAIFDVRRHRPHQALPDPPHALPINLAKTLSAGGITPADAAWQKVIMKES